VKKAVLKYDGIEDITNLEVHNYGSKSKVAVIQVSLNRKLQEADARQTFARIKEELKSLISIDSAVYCIE
jgi:divalent metal cation (Fe/Co/Zn/Cd) transporter